MFHLRRKIRNTNGGTRCAILAARAEIGYGPALDSLDYAMIVEKERKERKANNREKGTAREGMTCMMLQDVARTYVV